MVRRYNRLLVAIYVVTDALLASWAFILAYGIRFESGLIPVSKGYPPIQQYIDVLPFVALLTPLAFQVQGVYRLRRGRSRVDDFFAVLIGSILAVVFCQFSTLYAQAYFLSIDVRAQGAVSQLVWALFLGLTVAFTYASREAVRELLERRWRAGIGLKRILIAGVGHLGRMVADRMLQHRELGYQCIGFVDDRAGGDHVGYRGLPLLGTLGEIADIARHEEVVTHESLNGGGARAVGVSKAGRNLALKIEGQAVVGAAGEIVEIAAHRREEIMGFHEAAGGVIVNDAVVGELADVGNAVEVLREPEQSMQIAKAALVFLDVGLEPIA